MNERMSSCLSIHFVIATLGECLCICTQKANRVAWVVLRKSPALSSSSKGAQVTTRVEANGLVLFMLGEVESLQMPVLQGGGSQGAM